MNNDIILVGAGGLGREILWLLEELNSYGADWHIKGFVDDNEVLEESLVNGYPVLGNVEWLSKYESKINVVCCIANSKVRFQIMNRLMNNNMLEFPNIIAYGTRYSGRVKFGIGNIICLNSSLTVDINIGNFNIINPGCTIGHDVIMQDYVTLYPGVNVSGNVRLGNKIEIGTGTQIIQGLSICEDVIAGAGSVIIRDISDKGTYVGVPARRIK